MTRLRTRHACLLRDGTRRATSFARHRARGGVRVDTPTGDAGSELPPNWWTPLLSSDGSGKVSNGPGTASVYAENMRLWTGTSLATGGRVGLCAACSIDSSRVSGSPP